MPPKKAAQTKAIATSTTIPISQPSNTRYADNRERRMTRHDYPLATPMGFAKGGVLRVASGGPAVVRSARAAPRSRLGPVSTGTGASVSTSTMRLSPSWPPSHDAQATSALRATCAAPRPRGCRCRRAVRRHGPQAVERRLHRAEVVAISAHQAGSSDQFRSMKWISRFHAARGGPHRTGVLPWAGGSCPPLKWSHVSSLDGASIIMGRCSMEGGSVRAQALTCTFPASSRSSGDRASVS
jgi:hypothetical protein